MRKDLISLKIIFCLLGLLCLTRGFLSPISPLANPKNDRKTIQHMSGLFGEVQPLEKKKRLSEASVVSNFIVKYFILMLRRSFSSHCKNEWFLILFLNQDWQVYVDQSKASLDRGGSATLDAFCGLAPSSKVEIVPAILPKSKNRFPWVRCVSTAPGRKNFDVGNVDSVDKVFRVLTKHLEVENVNMEMSDCLKWKYKGNLHLETGKVDLAIDSYNKALSTCSGDKQEGVILLLRTSASLRQAQLHKQLLQSIVQNWNIPDVQDQQALLNGIAFSPGGAGLANSVLQKIENDGKQQQGILRQIQYRHGLYQYALLHAAQDALRATELLPNYSTSFLRAGEVLSEVCTP
jgi:hypothetical protein